MPLGVALLLSRVVLLKLRRLTRLALRHFDDLFFIAWFHSKKSLDERFIDHPKMTMDEFNAISKGFLDWLSRSGANINPKIEIADLRQQNAGRGVGTPFRSSIVQRALET